MLRFLYRRRLAGYPYDYAQLCDCRPAGARRNAAENGCEQAALCSLPAGAVNDRLYSAAYRITRRPAGDDSAGDGAVGRIAAGSERIAYAGIQIGFTFSLAFLSWFGPLTNLTELRDRVIGILLGVLVSSIVHLYLWPDSEAPQLKSRLADLYRRIADDLRASRDEVKLVPLFHALNSAETLMHRVAAEPLNAYAHPHPEAKPGR